MSKFDGNGVPVKRCCAACQRGSRAFGLLPCGRDGVCACHKPSTGVVGGFPAEDGLVPMFDGEAVRERFLSNEDSGGFSDV